MANLKETLKTAAKVSPITAAISATASAAPAVKEFFDPKSGVKPKNLGQWKRKLGSKVDKYLYKNHPKVVGTVRKIQRKAKEIENKINKKISIHKSKKKNPEAWKEFEEAKTGGRIGRTGGGAALRGLGRAFLKGGKV